MPEGDPSQRRFEIAAAVLRIMPSRSVGALAAAAAMSLPIAAPEAHAPIKETAPATKRLSPPTFEDSNYPTNIYQREKSSGTSSPPVEQTQKLSKDIPADNSARQAQKNLETDVSEETGCTSIRTMKDGIYLGKACMSRGDSYTPAGKQDFKEWTYSLVRLKQEGVYKCGYVRPVIKTPIPENEVSENVQNGVAFCSERQESIKRRSKYFEDHNSETTKSGKDKAKDGSGVKIKDDCDGADRRTYANFTPVARLNSDNNRHILNVFGIRLDNSFSFVLANNEDKRSLLYRRKIKLGGFSKGKRVKAAIVRTNDVDEELGWGFTDQACLKEEAIKTHG